MATIGPTAMTDRIHFTLGQRLYFGLVIGAGLIITASAATQLYLNPVPAEWVILAALTLLTGSFTIRITKLSIRMSVSDAFVFAAVLLFGTAAATVIVAVDSIVATVLMQRQNRSLFRLLYNLAVASISLWVASTIFYLLVGDMPTGRLVLTDLLGPLFVLAAVYFALNSWIIAIALGFEQKAPIARLWWSHFPWFSLNYFGGVSAAALLVSYTRTVDIGAVSIILPLLIISYLTYRTSLGRVQDAQQHVEQLNELYMSTIETLAMAVDAKDQITHGHIRRVQVYAVELAKRLGVTDAHQLQAIEAAALLHDMGKLAIPEHILNKPGKLTPAEFEKMKRHADIGADLLSSIKFPYPVVPIVRHHHESWNGQGYPSGISGTDIPLGARILSVVDCFDALNSDRPYRPRLSAEEAFTILRQRRGTMYDPLVVDKFISSYHQIAPLATLAGQEARSLLTATGLLEGSGEKQALNQIRANASETALLNDCADRIDKAGSLGEAMDLSSQALRQLTPTTTCAFYRYDANSDSLICELATGDPNRHLPGLTIRLGERVSGWVAANQRTSMNSDASLDLFHIAGLFQPALRSTVAVPLIDGDRLLGVVTGYSVLEQAFNESHLYAVERIGGFLKERSEIGIPHSRSVLPFKASRG
jgi:putative nucleotidyltransferase with HDIG domain